MSAKYDLERRIADHYAAETPPRAPDWVLERILTSVDITPQRRTVFRGPWRFPTMPSTYARLGVTAAAIATIGLVGLALLRQPAVGPAASASHGPSSSPSASPEPSSSPSAYLPPPLTERFDSTIHGISIDYPSGWQIRPATDPWNHDAVTFGASDVDLIFDPTLQADLYIALASEPLRGLSGEDWGVNPVDFCGVRGDGVGATGGSYTLDGAHGFAWSRVRGVRPAGCEYVAAATATRGYFIGLFVGEEGHPEAFGWGWFESLLETVNLRPEDALDALSPSKSP